MAAAAALTVNGSGAPGVFLENLAMFHCETWRAQRVQQSSAVKSSLRLGDQRAAAFTHDRQNVLSLNKSVERGEGERGAGGDQEGAVWPSTASAAGKRGKRCAGHGRFTSNSVLISFLLFSNLFSNP